MDRKTIKKSCKICLALIIGISLGFAISKMLEKNKDKEDNVGDCQCGS